MRTKASETWREKTPAVQRQLRAEWELHSEPGLSRLAPWPGFRDEAGLALSTAAASAAAMLLGGGLIALDLPLGTAAGLEPTDDPNLVFLVGMVFVLISLPLWLVSVCTGAIGLVYGPRRERAAGALVLCAMNPASLAIPYAILMMTALS